MSVGSALIIWPPSLQLTVNLLHWRSADAVKETSLNHRDWGGALSPGGPEQAALGTPAQLTAAQLANYFSMHTNWKATSFSYSGSH